MFIIALTKMGATCSQSSIPLLILGTEKSGKTTLFYYMKLKKFQKVLPTVGMNEEDIIFNKKHYNVMDLSEQSILDEMLRKAVNVLYLIDPSGDVEDQQEYINNVKTYTDKNLQFAITKADTIEKINQAKIIQEYELDEKKYKIYQIDCTTGLNISNVLNLFSLQKQE